MIPASQLPNPSPARLAVIRANRAKHLARLRAFWETSLLSWLGNTRARVKAIRKAGSRSRYNPAAEDRKHQALR